MRIEDYLKYRIQGGDIYVLPVDIFDELFDKLLNFQNENQRQKSAIDRAKNLINDCLHYADEVRLLELVYNILKEVK